MKILSGYSKTSPNKIIQEILTLPQIMTTYIITQKKYKAATKKPTSTDNLLTYITENKLGEIIKSPEIYTNPGEKPAQWHQVIFWIPNIPNLNKLKQ